MIALLFLSLTLAILAAWRDRWDYPTVCSMTGSRPATR